MSITSKPYGVYSKGPPCPNIATSISNAHLVTPRPPVPLWTLPSVCASRCPPLQWPLKPSLQIHPEEVSEAHPRSGSCLHYKTCKGSVALGIKTRLPNSVLEAPHGVVLPALLQPSSWVLECMLTLPQGLCTGSLQPGSSILPLHPSIPALKYTQRVILPVISS